MQPSPSPQPDPWPPKLDSIVLEDNWNVEMRGAVAACPEFGEWWDKRLSRHYSISCKGYAWHRTQPDAHTTFEPAVSELKKQFAEAKEKEFLDARQRLRELQWHTEHPVRVAAVDAATAKSIQFETRRKELYDHIPRLYESQVQAYLRREFGNDTFRCTEDGRLLSEHQTELESIACLRVTLRELVDKYGAPTTPEARAPSPPLLEDDVEAQL